VTLALALAVTENSALSPPVQRFIAVLATGLRALSRCWVNGTTLGLLIRLLGLDRLSAARSAFARSGLTVCREIGWPTRWTKRRALSLRLAN